MQSLAKLSLNSSFVNSRLGIPNMKNTILLDVGLRGPYHDKLIVSFTCFECPSHQRPTHQPPMNKLDACRGSEPATLRI